MTKISEISQSAAKLSDVACMEGEKADGSSCKIPYSVIGFSGALVCKAADQTAANFTAGASLTWDSEGTGCYDTNNYHSTASNTDRLTVSAAGYYRVGGHVDVTSLASSDYLRIFITRYNSGGVAQSLIGLPQGVITEISASPNISVAGWSAAISCSAGDYFTLTLDTEADTSITVVAAQSWFAIERLA